MFRSVPFRTTADPSLTPRTRNQWFARGTGVAPGRRMTSLGVFRFVLPVFALVAAASCSSSSQDAPAAPPPGAASPPAVPELGAPDARALVVVGTKADGLDTPRDLAFDAEVPDRLWVVNA